MNGTDAYRTLAKASKEAVYKEKGSKFLAYAYPVTSEEEAEQLIADLRKKHPKSRHCCYAWQIGTEEVRFRHNDDGEPTNSAGKPIYGQLQSFELTDVLVAVVRYFGGVKLGVGGLINAYRSAAKACLQEAQVIRKYVIQTITLRFEYADMDRIMRVIKDQDLDILDQQMGLDCLIRVSVRKSRAKQAVQSFESLRSAEVKLIN